MATQNVTITLATTPTHLVDQDAVKLAAAKVVTPAATNSHGVTILSISPYGFTGNPAAPAATGSTIVCSVTT